MAKATTVGAVGVDLKLNDSNYDKQLNNKLKSSENAFSGTFKKICGFIAGAFAVKQVVNFTKECVSSASKAQSAFTGLNSIVQGTGNSFSEAQDFIKKYTADGLVSIEETATAYKNLLSRGYDTSQIEDTLTRLKDSAAFGRQASYDLGEAVVTATEGLKNENSILVDNAGVTKNVAKMWEDWAKAHGTTTSAMTQAQKIQAEYNGIMKETRFQVGDASAYTKTFSGQIQQLKFNFNQMTVAIGKVVTPIAQLFIPIINSAINAVTRLFEKIQVVMGTFGLKMPDVVSKTSDSIAGIGTSAKDSANDAVTSAKKINKAFAGVDEVNVLKTKDSSSGSGDGGGTDTRSSTSIVTPTIDDSGTISILDKIKDKVKSAWNSEPISAFVGAVTNYGSFLWDYWKTLGTDFVSNSKTTWDNIKGNVSITLTNMSGFWTTFWTDISNGIQTWGQPIIDGVSGLFNSIWTTAIDPALQLITQGWADFSGILKILWDKHGAPLVNNIGEFVTNIISLFQKVWDNVLEPIITPFLETMSWLWEEHLSKVVTKVGDFIGKLVNGALEIYNKFIYPIMSWIYDKLAPVFSYLGNLISGVFGSVVAVISDVVGSIFRTLGGIIDFITGIFTGNWKKAWQGVKDIFGGIVDSLVAVFKFPINLIIDGINAFIGGLNKIKIPSWVPGVGGKGLNIGKIPKLAQGGYFKKNDPQLAIVGDNKREPEITTPESKIYEQAMKAIKDSNSLSNTKEMRIILEVRYEDGRKIIKKINQAQIEEGEVLLLV